MKSPQSKEKTYTWMDAISRVPSGFAVNRNEESAIAASKHIVHVERSAEILLILA